MSSVVSKNYQIGADGTATNNFTIRQPATPDGTVRIANGNTGSTTDLVTLTSAGNLGVGTSSPGRKLDVYGAGQFKDASGIANTIWSEFSTGIAGIGTNNNYPLALVTNGTQKALLDSSGNLGLGVTPSAWNTGKVFSVYDAGNSLWANSAGSLGMVANAYYNAGWKYQNNGYAMRLDVGNANGTFSVSTAPSGTAGNAISFTQAMTLNASGQLLLGTSTTVASDALLTVSNGGAVGMEFSPTAISGENRLLSYNRATSTYALMNYVAAVHKFAVGTSEAARIDSNGNFQMNSGYGSVATAYGCRAWVNFNGTGTVAIRASGNVSSITDNGTGDYTVNFTNAMIDANFATNAMAGKFAVGDASTRTAPEQISQSTTSVRIVCVNHNNGVNYDNTAVSVVVFR